MFAALSKKLLLGVAFLFALPTFAGQYPDEAKSIYTTVIVHVVWLPSFDVTNLFCSHIMNKPISTEGKIVGCYDRGNQTIYAVEPRNFNDLKRLSILGHEFWHALGAEHPE